MNIIDIARECGADDLLSSFDGPYSGVALTFSQLTALESRIRADEREKLSAWISGADDMSDAEVARLALTGRSVEEIRADINKVRERIRNSVHSDAAPVAEPESMNSHLTDGDGSQVQAQ